MADDTTRDILVRLREHEEALKALRQTRLARRRVSRSRVLAALSMALLIALVPLSLMAANPFTDLTGGAHDNDIDLIFNAGITKGCTPTEYCPTDNVTREQMASFLARTAGLGDNAPVTNAKTLAGYAPNALVRVASNSEASADATIPVLALQAPTPTIGATVTIEAPSAGFILVNANAMFRFTACGACTTTAILGGASATVTGAEATLTPISLTWVFPVSEAGTVNIPLIFLTTRPGAAVAIPSATIQNPNMSALFVPFDGTGADATP